MEKDSKLRTLRLSYSDLTGLTVRPEVFAKAINRLEKLEAWSLQLRPEYVESLFTMMAEDSSKIKELEFSKKCLLGLNPDLLAMAENKLDNFDTRY